MNEVENNSFKKNKLILVVGIILCICIIAIIFLFRNNSNLSSNDNNGSTSSNGVYYDSSRKIKSTYTFDEATEKFAFVVDKSTLIFKKNDKVSLVFIQNQNNNNYYVDIRDIRFYYDITGEEIHNHSGSDVGTIKFGESDISDLEKFVNNFKTGNFRKDGTHNVKNIEVIESNKDYFIGSWIDDDDGFKLNEYYYAQKIGNKIYFAYRSSYADESADFDLIVKEFKTLFSCLSEDDKQEPYIFDKILNVPVINKKISSNDKIGAIENEKVYVESGNDEYSLKYDAIPMK